MSHSCIPVSLTATAMEPSLPPRDAAARRRDAESTGRVPGSAAGRRAAAADTAPIAAAAFVVPIDALVRCAL